MTGATGAKAPPMGPVNVSSHLSGNKAALDEAWERDGYWSFRDVLDRGDRALPPSFH